MHFTQIEHLIDFNSFRILEPERHFPGQAGRLLNQLDAYQQLDAWTDGHLPWIHAPPQKLLQDVAPKHVHFSSYTFPTLSGVQGIMVFLDYTALVFMTDKTGQNIRFAPLLLNVRRNLRLYGDDKSVNLHQSLQLKYKDSLQIHPTDHFGGYGAAFSTSRLPAHERPFAEIRALFKRQITREIKSLWSALLDKISPPQERIHPWWATIRHDANVSPAAKEIIDTAIRDLLIVQPSLRGCGLCITGRLVCYDGSTTQPRVSVLRHNSHDQEAERRLGWLSDLLRSPASPLTELEQVSQSCGDPQPLAMRTIAPLADPPTGHQAIEAHRRSGLP